MTSRPRDSQRSKVYAAEQAVRDYGRTPIPDIADVRAYVERVCDRKTLQRHYHTAYVEVGDGRSRRSAAADGLGVYIPRSCRQPWIILHELAHVFTIRKYGWIGAAAHGWQFCDTLLALYSNVLGRDAAAALRSEFKARKVRYTKPRPRRSLTPEQREAAIARLAQARAAKAARPEGT